MLLEQFAKLTLNEVQVLPRDAFKLAISDPKSVMGATLQVHVGRCAIIPVEDYGWLVILSGGYIFIPVKFGGNLIEAVHGDILRFLALHGMQAGPGKKILCMGSQENEESQLYGFLILRQLIKDGARSFTSYTIF